MTANDALAWQQRDYISAALEGTLAIRDLVDTLADEVIRLRGLCGEVAASPPEFDDDRLRYVVVQIDRETWEALKGAAK
jgi:hypothetical protein